MAQTQRCCWRKKLTCSLFKGYKKKIDIPGEEELFLFSPMGHLYVYIERAITVKDLAQDILYSFFWNSTPTIIRLIKH